MLITFDERAGKIDTGYVEYTTRAMREFRARETNEQLKKLDKEFMNY